MMENLAEGLGLFLSVNNFAAIAIGVIVGIVVGAIPGLTAVMAIALALPFTFGMDPVTAILLLVGVYKGGIFGGSITAILIQTPGTPAAACTTLDGYPLAQSGQAGKALKMALYASCIADLISNLCLILFAGTIARLAIAFGPPEYFWLICFSLTVVISISGKSLTKGLISGLLGMLVATVGLDLVYGTQRFSYDNFNLMSGVSYIPLMIGLFALPQIIDFYLKKVQPLQIKAVDGSFVTLKEFKRSLVSIIRGSFIGVVIGAIPGAGATAAAFLSYGEAKRTSPNGENFGNGEIEGVAAAEAGNNGVAGATLIPLLALGIPGDVVTAVILGAFMIHGIAPGPLLFQDNITLIYAIFCGIALSSLVLFGAGAVSIRFMSRIADVPQRILFPIVLMFCIFGSFAVQSQMFDVLMMLAFGLIGFGMAGIKIPPAPFLMGFILSPLLEDNLRRSFLISDDLSIFFRSYICWIFIAITLLSLYVGVRRELQKLKGKTPQPQQNAH